MSSSSTITSAVALLATVLLLLAPHATPQSFDTLITELSALRSQSPTGVIRLTDDLLRRILDFPTPRPFHALIFFDAKHLHSNAELNLRTLKSEFSLVSSTFQSNNPNPDHDPKLLFFVIEFQESQSSFALFGVNSIPHIHLVPPTAAHAKNESIQIEPRMAESMAEFIESRTGLSVGPIVRPPAVSKKQVAMAVAVVLLMTPLFVKRLIAGNTFLHQKNFWMAGAVFIYFFSVSGGMFNIIRKMPMFMADRKDPSKTVYFFQGSGMQLGAEGFSVGSLYTIVGLLLATATHLLVRVRNLNVQRVFMVVGLVVSYWAVRKVISLDNWKTGYGIHGYWPSSWRR